MSATAPHCPPLDVIVEVFATLPVETQDALLRRWLRRALRVLPPPDERFPTHAKTRNTHRPRVFRVFTL